MKAEVALGIPALLFLVGAYALFARHHRDDVIRTLNTPWHLIQVRVTGLIMMLTAIACVVIFVVQLKR